MYIYIYIYIYTHLFSQFILFTIYTYVDTYVWIQWRRNEFDLGGTELSILHMQPWKNNIFLKHIRMLPKSSVHSNYCYLFTTDKSPFHWKILFSTNTKILFVCFLETQYSRALKLHVWLIQFLQGMIAALYFHCMHWLKSWGFFISNRSFQFSW